MNKFKEGDVVEIITNKYDTMGEIFKITQYFKKYDCYSDIGHGLYSEDELRLVEEKQFNFDIL